MEDLVSAPWLRRLIIAGLLAACVLLGFRVMDPFIVPLVWAGILAFVSWPAYRWLRDKCRGHTTVAALLMTGAVTAAVIAPLAWLAVVLRVELAHTWRETQTLLAGGVQLPPAGLQLPWFTAWCWQPWCRACWWDWATGSPARGHRYFWRRSPPSPG